MFKATDGYWFYFVGGKWVDHPNPGNVDMTFEADEDGWPIDNKGAAMEGYRFLPHVETDADDVRHNTIVVLCDGQKNFVEQVENNEAGRSYLSRKYGARANGGNNTQGFGFLKPKEKRHGGDQHHAQQQEAGSQGQETDG